jgi:hypothetical protein
LREVDGALQRWRAIYTPFVLCEGLLSTTTMESPLVQVRLLKGFVQVAIVDRLVTRGLGQHAPWRHDFVNGWSLNFNNGNVLAKSSRPPFRYDCGCVTYLIVKTLALSLEISIISKLGFTGDGDLLAARNIHRDSKTLNILQEFLIRGIRRRQQIFADTRNLHIQINRRFGQT